VTLGLKKLLNQEMSRNRLRRGCGTSARKKTLAETKRLGPRDVGTGNLIVEKKLKTEGRHRKKGTAVKGVPRGDSSSRSPKRERGIYTKTESLPEETPSNSKTGKDTCLQAKIRCGSQ